VVEWSVPDGAAVEAGMVVAIADTSKAAFEIEAETAGFLFHLAQAGDRVLVGDPIAVISKEPVRPQPAASPQGSLEDAGAQNITRRALELIARHQIPASVFAGKAVVRQVDVEEYLRSNQSVSRPQAVRFFGDEALDLNRDWSSVDNPEELTRLRGLLTGLRRQLKARFNRHVPVGTLLHDRWEVAREYRFGEGTSVYDECLILGDVTVGKHCWVGPFTVLDGNFAPLRIGDYTSIGSGAHIYTHHAIDNAITKGRAPIYKAETTIGEACFISPLAMVGPGSVIGDHSFVASGSFVQGEFPEFSYLAGSPARRIGRVEIKNDRVLLLKEP
jgi:acetyltransferase-like isoleucine patch superfamily enzyme